LSSELTFSEFLLPGGCGQDGLSGLRSSDGVREAEEAGGEGNSTRAWKREREKEIKREREKERREIERERKETERDREHISKRQLVGSSVLQCGAE